MSKSVAFLPLVGALALGCGSETEPPVAAPQPVAVAPDVQKPSTEVRPPKQGKTLEEMGLVVAPKELQPPIPEKKFELTDATARLRAEIDKTDDFERAAGLATLLPTLGPEALPDVEAIVTKQRDIDLNAVELVLLTRFWAEHDAQAAAQWALMRSPGGYRTAVIMPAVETLARRDPLKANEIIQPLALLPGKHLEAAQVALIRGWYGAGHPGLQDFIRSFGVGYDRQRMLNVWAREILQNEGIDELMRIGEALPEDELKFKLEAFSKIATQLTLADPQAGVEWCRRHCDSPFGINIRSLVAQRWASFEGLPALLWASTAPVANKQQNSAVMAAHRGWWRRDPDGFTAWIEPQKEAPPEWLDPAISRYAMWISPDRPAEGIEWALKVRDQNKREQALVTIIRRWRGKDEAAALAVAEQLEMSEEGKKRVLMTYAEERAIPRVIEPIED
jgi:hypothetical protein